MTREQVLREIAESGYELSPEDQAFMVGLLGTTNWTVGHVAPVIDAIRRGVSPEDFAALSPAAMERLEAQATDLYREQEYDDAFAIFAGLHQFAARQKSFDARVLRGMAACNHSQGYLLDALDQYNEALALDPTDLISRVALAQVLCLVGQRAKGLALAHSIVRGNKKSGDKKLTADAQALIANNGGQVNAELARRRADSKNELPKQSTNKAAYKLAEEMLAAMKRHAT